MCLIAEDLSQSAGYEQLQWSLSLSVCLIASNLSRYAGYELFQWSHSVCLICLDPLGLSRSARSGLVTSFATQFAFDTKQVDKEGLMGRGEFASGEVLPSEKVTIHFYSWKIGLQNSREVFIWAEKLFSSESCGV